MKKIDIYSNNEVIYALPPEPIDGNEPVCLVDYMLPRSKERTLDYSRMRRFGEDSAEISVDFGTCLNAQKTNQKPLSMPVLGVGRGSFFMTYSK